MENYKPFLLTEEAKELLEKVKKAFELPTGWQQKQCESISGFQAFQEAHKRKDATLY